MRERYWQYGILIVNKIFFYCLFYFRIVRQLRFCTIYYDRSTIHDELYFSILHPESSGFLFFLHWVTPTVPANVCGKSLHLASVLASTCIRPRKYVHPSLQVRASVPASTCIRPCKYVQPSPQVRASVLASTWIRPCKYRKLIANKWNTFKKDCYVFSKLISFAIFMT